MFGQPLRSIVIPEPWYTGQIDEEELDDTADDDNDAQSIKHTCMSDVNVQRTEDKKHV